MTYTLTQPQVLAAAAADVTGIGSALNAANSAAAGPTTALVAAAADEVSAATATLFNTYAQQYQALINQAEAFQEEFAQTLAAAATAYAEAEAAAAAALAPLTQTVQSLLAPLTGGSATGASGVSGTVKVIAEADVAFIMGGTDIPTPPPPLVSAVYQRYIAPSFPVPSGNVQGLFTPEGLYPVTAVKELTLDMSLARGAAALKSAILQQLALPGTNSVVVGGYSQSSMVASLVMPQLIAEQVPQSAVSFVLLGNPMNPNGGIAARFPGASAPSLGLTAYGATPANDYPTITYTIEYDGFADFPRYPINILSVLNAIVGGGIVHGWYPYLDPTALPPGFSLVELPTEGPTTSTYYMITVPDLPLLTPIRWIPYIGNPIADVLQGPLEPIVNWGYGDPAYGYSTGPANVPTPFGFLPPPSATLALGPAIVSGTQNGIINAYHNLLAEGPPSLPAVSLSDISQVLASQPFAPSTLALPTSPASAITGALMGLQAANTQVASYSANAVSASYATMLPSADLGLAVSVSLPTYVGNLFLDGINQAVNGQPLVGLVNAIGRPYVAGTLWFTFAGATQLIVLGGAGYMMLTGTQLPFVESPIAGLPTWLLPS